MRRAPGGLLLVLLSMAGCTGAQIDSQDPELLGPGTAQFDDSTGAVEGVVKDDALLPVSGAVVILNADRQAMTDASGQFAFSFVPPGNHVLDVHAEGYRQKQAASVEVLAGQVSRVNLLLIVEAASQGYHSTQTQSAYIGCSVNVRTPANPGGLAVAACGVLYYLGFEDLDRFRLDWNLGGLQNVTGLWVETTWESTQAAGNGLRVGWVFYVPEETWVRTLRGVDPLRSPIPIDDIPVREAGDSDCRFEECEMTSYHYQWARTLGNNESIDAGVTFQQRLDDWVTIFYVDPLPEQFTALRDK